MITLNTDNVQIMPTTCKIDGAEREWLAQTHLLKFHGWRWIEPGSPQVPTNISLPTLSPYKISSLTFQRKSFALHFEESVAL